MTPSPLRPAGDGGNRWRMSQPSPSSPGVLNWVLVLGLGVFVLSLSTLAAVYFATRAKEKPEETQPGRPEDGGFCPQCGRRVEAQDRFCRSCGAALRERD